MAKYMQKIQKVEHRQKCRIPPKRKLYIALRESRRCVNRNESEEENTRHHQPASSWLRNSQASFSVPRKHRASDSKGTLVSGSNPVVLSPSWLLTSAAHSREDIMDCTAYFVFSFKTTVVFQLFPCGGKTSLESKHNISCLLPLHHYTTPPSLGDHGFFACSRKWLPNSIGKKGGLVPSTTLMGKERRIRKHPHQHQLWEPPACSHFSTGAEQCAPEASQHPPTLRGTMLTAAGLVCVCAPSPVQN